jgi:hypothetical protein
VTLPARVRRELIIFLVLLAVGFFVLPWLIWVAGFLLLGAYANGGPFALFADFFVGLAHGSLVYWAVALGPWMFVLLARVLWRLLRSPRTTD